MLQFKVLEGENYDQARDITFDYNADFFVFASLEHARPMARGRVQTPAATSPPVLTGFPVAGCCYLDRPAPAGYFIFPDLSVRHEGRYRLVFTLYEQIKDEQDDEIEPRAEDREGIATGEDDGQGFYHRMEVKSDDFAVFSAKKFPGLSESTALSRTVAEQGCRVRIRRDVRMRRRDNKPTAGADYDDNAEEEYGRRRRTQTPDVLRPRSVSNSSMDTSGYGHDHSRRPSNADYTHHPPPPPMYQPNQPGRILSFGHGGQDCAPQVYAPPPPPGPLSTPVSPAHSAPFHPTSQVSSYPPPPSPGYITPQSGYYDRPSSSHDQEMKIQPSYNYPTTTMKPLAPMPSTPSSRTRGSTGSAILPSITAIERERSNSAAWSSRSDSFAKPPSLYATRDLQPTKRSHDDVFAAATQERTMNGHRPDVNYEDPKDPRVAWYKRANLEWKQRPFIV